MATEKEILEFKIPDDVSKAMETYYEHQVLANQTYGLFGKTEPEKVYQWDKYEDEKVVGAAAKIHGIGWERLAGTFYLYIPYDKYTVVVQTNNIDDVKRNGMLKRIYDQNSGEPNPAYTKRKQDRFENIL